ncbi:MAG: beta-galactosidase [Lentisphaeria bacterium]|jgi:hypothetical protein
MRDRLVVLSILVIAGQLCLGEPVLWKTTEVQMSHPTVTTVVPEGVNDAVIILDCVTPWPHIRLLPATGTTWDFSAYRYLSFELDNLCPDSSAAFKVCLENSSCALGSACVPPGATKAFTFRLRHAGDPGFDPLFKGRRMPDGFPGGGNGNTAAVASIQFIIPFPVYFKVRLRNLRVHGERVVNPAVQSAEAFFPLVDDFGQYVHSDWPTKVRTQDELQQRHQAEAAALRESVPTWNRWGGWTAGPQLRATGFFRAEKYAGKWYLVDPDGRLFFSRGVNGLSAGAYWLNDGERAKLFRRPRPASGNVFNFYKDNILAKHGSAAAWNEFQLRRLQSWGFNTIANWSEPALYQAQKIPYALNLPLPKCPKVGNIIDVYADEFAAGMADLFGDKFAYTREDPYCIGFFVGNELKFGSATHIGEQALAAKAEQPAKRELLRQLQAKYADMAACNAAWETNFGSWDEWLAAEQPPPTAAAAQTDLAQFSRAFAERFLRMSREAVKRGAPNHLYLGSRLMSPDYFREYINELSAQYCDVVSYNMYLLHFDHFRPRGLPRDIPVMITENSVGTEERGLFGTLVCAGAMPGDRETALRELFTSVLRHPQLVGLHHFVFKDQTLVGRWDGENYGFGLVDVTDTPYQEFVDVNRAVAETMYDMRRTLPRAKFPDGAD